MDEDDKPPAHVRPRLVRASITYEAPLPPPEYARQYEALYPGFTRESMAELRREQEHRHAMDSRAQEIRDYVARKNVQMAERGQGFAIVSTVALLFICGWLLARGYVNQGVALLGIGGAVTLIPKFLNRT